MGLSVSAWTREPPLVDEREFTPEAPLGWHAWEGTDGMPAELEFCEFARALVRLMRPRLVIETGTGTGFTTRRLADALPADSRMRCYESDADYRDALRRLPFFRRAGITLADESSPPALEYREAELTVMDSEPAHRLDEIAAWGREASERAVILIHDTKAYPEGELVEAIMRARIRGVWLTNPRGCFLGQR